MLGLKRARRQPSAGHSDPAAESILKLPTNAQ